MAPTQTFELTALTKEDIGGIYFRSLSSVTTRKNHALLNGVVPGLLPKAIEADFCTWYGGFISLAHEVDSTVALPATQEMTNYISQNMGRAQAAIAA